MNGRPPSSTPFPTTTLFRSQRLDGVDEPELAPGADEPPEPAVPVQPAPEVDPPVEPEPAVAPAAIEPLGRQHQAAQAQDRKSTRLNSSHANISYAVFCLKKK